MHTLLSGIGVKGMCMLQYLHQTTKGDASWNHSLSEISESSIEKHVEWQASNLVSMQRRKVSRVPTKTFSQPSSIDPFDMVAQMFDGWKKLLQKVMFVI